MNDSKQLKVKEKNKWEVIPSKLNEFLGSQINTDFKHLVKPKEIILIGRSNTGKSSLLNKITNTKLNTTSRKQGNTRKLYSHSVIGMGGVDGG